MSSETVAAETVVETKTWAVGAAEKIVSHPKVQEALRHPLLQHPALRHPLLADPKVVAIASGLLVILLVLCCTPSGRKSAKKGTPNVVFVGPPASGKTALFSKLTQDENPATHTSLVSSVTTVALPSADGATKTVTLVDVPGHARLRDQVSKLLPDSTAVVFVVDIVNLVRNASSVAEELPPLLTQMAGVFNRRLSGPTPQLLILGNKADLLASDSTSSKSPAEISSSTRNTAEERLRSILTREMDRLKAARGGSGGRIEGMSKVQTSRGFWGRLFGAARAGEIEAEGEDDEAMVWGGPGQFRWEDVEGVDISWGVSGVGPANALTANPERGNGLAELEDFLWDL